MLHLIFGTAGAGKTTLLHERIADCVSGGGRAILLVPEQYSFESEKALYRRLGARGALQVEVLSLHAFATGFSGNTAGLRACIWRRPRNIF